MTFAEFLEKARERDGWQVEDGLRIRNQSGHCPLQAVFGDKLGYTKRARQAGLEFVYAIIDAADGARDDSYRKALLTLVEP